jgi:hypothetical protein
MKGTHTMRRTLLLGLLGFGIFAGYGSAIASARWHARHHGGGCESRWGGHHGRFDRGERFEREAPTPTATPAPVIVPQAAAAPAPQVFVITVPGASPAPAAAPQVITVPVPTPAAP